MGDPAILAFAVLIPSFQLKATPITACSPTAARIGHGRSLSKVLQLTNIPISSRGIATVASALALVLQRI